MPESRRRKKDDYVPVSVSQTPVKLESSRWTAPLMVIFLVVGLLWVVAFYIAGSSIPVMKDLGNLVNVGIGFSLMAVGFFFATKWR
ncbi:MAG: hypothetical protein RIS09_1155 [Actinomycetota bacterium]|jgi:hypothetical protein